MGPYMDLGSTPLLAPGPIQDRWQRFLNYFVGPHIDPGSTLQVATWAHTRQLAHVFR
jgi:hypothetical protein